MRDLLRNYKLLIKPRSTESDSDTESQPLLSSSECSTISFGSTDDRMFNQDTETSDSEREDNKKNSDDRKAKDSNRDNPDLLTPKILIRRPFCFPSKFDNPTLDDVYSNNENIVERYRYYSQVSGILTENPLLCKKIIEVNYTEYESIDVHNTNSSLITIFAVWNTIMGSGLLAMPWGIEKAGLIPGIMLMILVSLICLYTAYLLLNVNAKQAGFIQINEVPDLCRILLGRWAEYLAKMFSLIILIGANIVYWILMSNFFYNSVNFIYAYIFSNETSMSNVNVICPKEHLLNLTNATTIHVEPMAKNLFEKIWDLYSTVPIFLAIIMFPLLNFKSATFFTKFNSLGTLSAFNMLIFIAIKGYTWGINIPNWEFEFHIKSNFSALTGLLSMSYYIHNIIVSIMKNNRYQQHNGRDLSIAFCLVTFTYLFIGVTFYVTFPLAKTCIEDNLLNNFDKFDTLTIIARLLLFFQLITVFPLIAYMLRIDILTNVNMIFKGRNYGHFTYGRVVFINLIVVIICVLFAIFLPKIGTLIRYTGALSGLVYIFTLPCLLQMATLRNEKSLTFFKALFYCTIIVIGFLNLISQFFIDD